MQQWGLHRRIALNIIAAIGVSPRRIVLGFMIATAFVSLWISNTATTVMMFPIGMAVLLKLGEQMDKDDPLLRRFGLALMLGIAYAASIGGIGTKIGTAPNIIMVKQAATVFGRDIDFATWLMIGLPIVVVALPLVFLFLVHVSAPIPATGFPGASDVVTRERAELGRMSAGERVAFTGFLTAALLWIFRNDIELGAFTIPGWWSLVHFGWQDILSVPVDSLPSALAKLMQQDLGDAAVAMGVATALLLIPITLRPLRFALDIRRAAGVPWGLLVLLGGGLAMAYGMQRSGLSTWLGGQLQGIGHVGPFTAIADGEFCESCVDGSGIERGDREHHGADRRGRRGRVRPASGAADVRGDADGVVRLHAARRHAPQRDRLLERLHHRAADGARRHRRRHLRRAIGRNDVLLHRAVGVESELITTSVVKITARRRAL